jgi:hypothetical protein
MNISFGGLFIIFVVALYTNGCKKNSSIEAVPPPRVEWKIDNGATQTADTISFVRMANYNYIYAKKGTTDLYLATSSTLVGSYSPLSANATMGLTISGTQYSNLGCEITISSNSNSLLKGTFSGTFAIVNVDTVSITGTFQDVVYN